ncbi:MAG: TetR/AcrR family transcriptional regulator [Solirubrobacteraceae bacterium]
MAARRGSGSVGVSAPKKVGVRRNALKMRSSSGGGVSARYQVAEMQRARLLGAAAVTIGELGYAGASVAHITARARVSRRTFYDLFTNREDCLFAVLEDVVERVSGEIVAADLGGLVWRDRVRGGLLAILSFFDREPVLARVCVVDALQGGPRVLAWREGVLAGLARVLDEGRGESRAGSRGECTTLTAEGLVGAAFAIVHARLIAKQQRGALRDLVGELMSLIVLPYLGPGAARLEQERSLPPLPLSERATRERAHGAVVEPDLFEEVPMRLTYRTALVLDGIAKHPGASNRVVGERAGIFDQGQVSKLLARLQRLGLTANTGVGHMKGEPNAWSLTPLGVRVASRLSASAPGTGAGGV